MRKTLTYSLAAAALLTGGVAWAQADGRPDSAPHGDRSLTRAQVEQRAAEQFGRMDANKDGLLDQADREARQQAMFDRIDTDRNGAISPAEFSAMRAERGATRAERGARGARDAGRPLGRMGAKGPMRGMGAMGMARAADADRDGTVTQAEFASAALARFERLDADKDGTVSRDERRQQRREHRGDRRAG